MSLALGGVAQGLEQAAHNRLVVGSSPTAPTKGLFFIARTVDETVYVVISYDFYLAFVVGDFSSF